MKTKNHLFTPRRLGIGSGPRKAIAACSCGWKSPTGLPTFVHVAMRLHRDHLESVHQTDA